jgi:ABC-type multidrug transport system fused ATPase/permease subunit
MSLKPDPMERPSLNKVFKPLKKIATTTMCVLKVFTSSQRRKVLLIVFSQILLAGVDLVGVAIVGAIGAIAVAGVQSQPPPDSLLRILQFVYLDNQSIQLQVGALAVIATVFFTARTFLGMVITHRMLFFLSRRSAEVTRHLIFRIFNSGLSSIQSRSSQEYLFVITSGMNTLIIGVLSNVIIVLADAALLIILLTGLVIFNPIITIVTATLFATVGFGLYRFLNKRAEALGSENTSLHVKSTAKIQEVLSTYRENFVKDRLDFKSEELSSLRKQHSDVLAGMSYLPNVTKYSIELFVVVFIFLISAIEFARVDALHAVSTISVFLMASSRIAPAVLRIQQSLLSIQSAVGTSNSSIEILEDFHNYPVQVEEIPRKKIINGFNPGISVEKLSYTYPNSERLILDQISLEIKAGEFVAIVGPSGAGKSTLIDLILGLQAPQSGSIEISGYSSTLAPRLFAGEIGYLPQEVFILNGTLRENIALGYPADSLSDSEVWSALKRANAESFVQRLPLGIETLLGDGGVMLSGGEKQRLGIARTLVTNPSLIVMDEATSALDSQTEFELTQSISEFREGKTIIVVAHRLSTVMKADRVVYLSNGRIEAQGTFEEIRRRVPEFDTQAELQGIQEIV